MSTYMFNSTVTSQEADALKEMIFKRARERAQAFSDDVQSNYVSAVQNDIMDLARDSFVSTSKNPFVETKEDVEAKIQTEIIDKQETQEIGFAKRHVDEIKKQIYAKNKITNTTITNNEVESAMEEARASLGQKSGFIGALDFLNSQASIALIKNKGNAFEAMA